MSIISSDGYDRSITIIANIKYYVIENVLLVIKPLSFKSTNYNWMITNATFHTSITIAPDANKLLFYLIEYEYH